MKPRIEDLEVLQSAEENHQKFSKAPISDILELLKQTPFVENAQDMIRKSTILNPFQANVPFLYPTKTSGV